MSDTCLQHIEDYWKIKTEASNLLFNEGKYEEALAGYLDALCRAEVLNNNAFNCQNLGIPYVQLYIISINNMANTYEELGDIKEADNLLKQNIYFLLHLMSLKKKKNQNQIESELKRATLTYFQFTEKTGGAKVNTEDVFKRLQNELSSI
ncbi:tetratricopeptide repeat protein [Bizionia argentinensis JUB59]|uniref:Tetratricopeptide repeat protein n=1 Tax=Bizionia argentinensis JUB59 TaxID=1046627 RepID=G2EFX7_9FLAO|nr:hypothetical protein [Bizionia argentinensis]EGV42715.1 tetratricopeptide repeat protein [Bizionia argentinensis JUB59]